MKSAVSAGTIQFPGLGFGFGLLSAMSDSSDGDYGGSGEDSGPETPHNAIREMFANSERTAAKRKADKAAEVLSLVVSSTPSCLTLMLAGERRARGQKDAE